MCGVCGIIDLNNTPPIGVEELAAMCKAIEHRGPDGTRTMIRDSVAFGHTRLSVIDTETGWQPIANENGSVFVILNGEIYNFRELRKELEEAGHKFTTASDTEVVVHLYEEEGLDFVRRLDGMFALAVWDETNKRLVLARDRIGKKPLFYSESAGCLLFASEVKSLTESGRLARKVDPIALASYLTYGYVAEPRCIFAGISKLPPAHIIVYDASGLKVQRYWELNRQTDDAVSFDDAVSETRHLTDRAVSSRLISDVPLGFFLSGGLDSSIIVGAAAGASSSKLKTFSIGFEENSYSELGYARTVAERFDTDHEEFIVTADMALDLESMVRYADEPFADSSMVPMYYLSRQTRQRVTVALSGDGGDEVFGGYDRYIGLGLARKYHRIPGFLRKGLIGPLAGMIPESPGKRSNLRRIKRLTYPATDTAEQWYLGWMQQFRSESHSRAFTPGFASVVKTNGGWNDHMSNAFAGLDDPATARSAQWVDTMTYLPGDLLVKTDRMSMAHGLEVRSPYLDHRLVEFASTIPGKYSIRGRAGKQILKRAYADLIPDEISRRPKAGFTVPVGQWINGPLRNITRDLLLAPDAEVGRVIRPDYISRMVEQHASRHYNHSVRLWNLICLETWAQSFRVSLG
ncbi:asparagine synthase (glutamine-hydrolyzing) [SAR202 cluster bacterium AD-812-D07_MRT_10900m]|nr:asparagine synthase (glutamine-hydrolyzing) [SAR202 cluster bacterium AD-812-D07_MRT_10900m]